MTTPDPTLAARLAELRLSRMNGAAANGTFIKALATAFEGRQLITLADAEAMVRAENEACAAVAAKHAETGRKKLDAAETRDEAYSWGIIVTRSDLIKDAICERVQP